MATMHVLNRYSEKVEIQFDAAFNPESPYVWEPGEVKELPQDVALFCRRKSVVKEDPISGKQVRALLVQGIDKEYDEVVASGEFMPYRGPELLDRSSMTGGATQDRITYVPIANPQVLAVEREAVAQGTHTRRVND